MDIQAFLSALEGSEIGAYLVRQYYQPADTPEKHCFIMTPLDEAKEYKVKKCVQLQPTVIFKENDLYKILGID